MREKALDEEGEDEEEGPIRTSTSNSNRHSKGKLFTLTAINTREIGLLIS
jgi:hypothetical protein